ncbi:type IV secretory system conjugative DNA transfer family protein [Bradyrhizobium sp. SZCCHNS2002]|uniref:type IV secretory system conjugative DNA transfer family protein n=1 Tax=Bradyrhizobium sp. SZCCHNS2002 TaxID=3057302 RepID=UPI002916B888|nr:type IV secretory system conjugative DNA transfer family protein [Bradyrhizobium sp. SZCCHNS2002]
MKEIDDFHANELNPVQLRVGDLGLPGKSIDEAAIVINEKVTGKSRHDPGFESGNFKADMVVGVFSSVAAGARHSKAVGALNNTIIRRTLRDMSEPERGICRLLDMLDSTGKLSQKTLFEILVPIVWNRGSCLMDSPGFESAAQRVGLKEGLSLLLDGHFGDIATSSELIQSELRRLLQPDSGLADEDRNVLESYLFAGSRWLTPADAHIPDPSPSALSLGTFEGSDQELLYDRRESLVTIAPPGSGKSQAHVIRNLLRLRAPAVVIDIKTEALVATAKWRQQNVGPVIAFAPGKPKISSAYNPLDQVSDDGEWAWDDARKLADFLVVPKPGDPYFETRARDLLTVAVLDVALHEPSEHRNMHAVLDRLYLNEEQLADWLLGLEQSGIPQLRRQATALKIMPEKQREGVFDSARSHVEIWQSPALANLITRSEWTAQDIRDQTATLYLCVELADVKKFASVLRVIIGQTIDVLCRTEPEADAPVVTFFLDELPRLGRMDVIEEALDVGRGFGLRMWMFCQNVGQLKTAYPNAEGMIGNCAARCFMDPDDETAEELSRYLGHRKGLLDGRQKPLAEPSELKGPAFADKIIVFLRGKSPAKLMRVFPAARRPPAPRQNATG